MARHTLMDWTATEGEGGFTMTEDGLAMQLTAPLVEVSPDGNTCKIHSQLMEAGVPYEFMWQERKWLAVTADDGTLSVYFYGTRLDALQRKLGSMFARVSGWWS